MAIGVEGDPRVRVVHYRCAGLNRAGHEVVSQAQRVSDFVGGELTNTRQYHCLQLWRNGSALLVRRQERFGDQVILTGAQRTERDLPLDDLAGARIDNARAIRPSASGAMHPLDDVVAHVHGIGVFGKHLDAERISEACRLECLRPPACAFHKGCSNGLGGTAIHVIHDGLHRIAHRAEGSTFCKRWREMNRRSMGEPRGAE